ncbi:hypothetical protein ATE92_1699 [Ulvibacter sp. MAR_2010_11]|uniref:hypothetical protein n=1 Tax=Ulvibacter sp. MAR_2010_11 TaxID=1250229 RepID=UPI000C2BD19D|nr:hypothetical protein [Ulvibacter sp. MAR_2010_11]PKA83543.1 hypothetical protein ATE92_1699 [Ulvibacter sp. MAR_2010_11]
MKKTLFFGVIAVLLFVQCGKDNDPFLIKQGAIGNLTKEIRMKQIDSIFAQDSIVKLNPIADALGTQGEVEIYEKGGNKLLLLSPDNESDPESVITNIQIFDDRYKTEKGLSKSSNFKFVKDNYTLAGVETTINAVVIFLENSDIFITIDKKQLPENLRYDPTISIEASQIPDDATFKYFMAGWDKD